MKGLQNRVWSGRLSPHSNHCAAAATMHRLPQLVERPAFGRNRCCGSSFIEHDGPADPKMSAGSAVLVENGPRVSASMAKEREPRFCLGVLCCCCCQEGLCTSARRASSSRQEGLFVTRAEAAQKALLAVYARWRCRQPSFLYFPCIQEKPAATEKKTTNTDPPSTTVTF